MGTFIFRQDDLLICQMFIHRTHPDQAPRLATEESMDRFCRPQRKAHLQTSPFALQPSLILNPNLMYAPSRRKRASSKWYLRAVLF